MGFSCVLIRLIDNTAPCGGGVPAETNEARQQHAATPRSSEPGQCGIIVSN